MIKMYTFRFSNEISN